MMTTALTRVNTAFKVSVSNVETTVIVKDQECSALRAAAKRFLVTAMRRLLVQVSRSVARTYAVTNV